MTTTLTVRLKYSILFVLAVILAIYTNIGLGAVKFSSKYTLRLNGNYLGTLRRIELPGGGTRLTFRLVCNAFPNVDQGREKLKKDIENSILSGVNPRAATVLEFFAAHHIEQFLNAPQEIVLEYIISATSPTTTEGATPNGAVACEPAMQWVPGMHTSFPYTITITHLPSGLQSSPACCCWSPGVYTHKASPKVTVLNHGPGYFDPSISGLLGGSGLQQWSEVDSTKPGSIGPHPSPGADIQTTLALLAQEAGEDLVIGSTVFSLLITKVCWMLSIQAVRIPVGNPLLLSRIPWK